MVNKDDCLYNPLNYERRSIIMASKIKRPRRQKRVAVAKEKPNPDDFLKVLDRMLFLDMIRMYQACSTFQHPYTCPNKHNCEEDRILTPIPIKNKFYLSCKKCSFEQLVSNEMLHSIIKILKDSVISAEKILKKI